MIGYSHEREAVRVFRLSRIQGKVGYATKAEHDFSPPEDFDRRDYGSRADWQLGETQGTAKIWIRERIAWLIERDFGTYGDDPRRQSADKAPGKGKIFETDYASHRELIAWVAALARQRRGARPGRPARGGRGARRHPARPPQQRLRARRDRRPAAARRAPPLALQRPRRRGDPAGALRPPRHPRRDADRSRRKTASACRSPTCASRLELTEDELREDIELLNVVNFGGGTYVLYAEILGDEIEVDSEPYGDNFARPARLLPLEAKALIAAIDLFGDHLPQSNLEKAREKIVKALGHDPSEEGLEIVPAGGGDASVARAPEPGDRRLARCWSSPITRRTRTN